MSSQVNKCAFKLTAGKNKGMPCGKIDCKAHIGK